MRKVYISILTVLAFLAVSPGSMAIDHPGITRPVKSVSDFVLIEDGKPVPIIV